VPTFFISKTTNNIGINTENPLAALHVAGYGFVSGGQSSFFYPLSSQYTVGANVITALNNLPSFTANLGILADYGIVSKTYVGSALNVIASDNRIKNIISLSNNSEDLERLKKIQITNYRMKDVATWGTQTFKKVIAQQVESVYPEVISKTKSVIPDIYALAESVGYDAQNKKLNISLSKDYGVKVGEKIELVHPEKGKIQAEVVEVSGKSFTVKNWDYPTDKIFVFGREVNDFRSVDYEALSMLGISAIQALAKEVEGLKKENIQLKSDFNKRLESIEASLRLTNQSTIK
jgi:Chaperone of endosialidase